MIELRWIVPEVSSSATHAPRLQYRTMGCSATEGYQWEEWTDVPTVVVGWPDWGIKPEHIRPTEK